jgi:hypothetical protein
VRKLHYGVVLGRRKSNAKKDAQCRDAERAEKRYESLSARGGFRGFFVFRATSEESIPKNHRRPEGDPYEALFFLSPLLGHRCTPDRRKSFISTQITHDPRGEGVRLFQEPTTGGTTDVR